MKLLRKYLKMCTAVCIGLSLWSGQADSSYAASSSPILVKEWTQFYGNTANYNEPRHVAPTSDGGSVILGGTTARDGFITKIYVVKTDKEGKEEWANEYFEDKYDTEAIHGYNIRQTKDGGYLIGGAVKDDSGGKFVYRAYLLKLSASGEREWGQMYGNSLDNPVNEVKETRDGGYIATTSTYNMSGTAPAYIVKVGPTGAKEWEHYFKYNEIEDYSDDQMFGDVIETDNGDYWAVGTTRVFEAPQSYPLLVKYDASGKVKSKRTKQTSDWGRLSYHHIERAPERDGYLLLNVAGLWKVNEEGQTVWNKKLTDTTPELANTDLYNMAPAAGGFLINGKNRVTGDHVTVTVNSRGEILEAFSQEIPGYSLTKINRVPIPGGGLLLLGKTDNAEQLELIKFKSVTPNENPGGNEGTYYLDSEEYSITVNTTIDIVALFKKTDGTIIPVTTDTRFTIEHPGIASIDNQGNITGLAPGLTKVTAEYQGYKAEATVLIVRPYIPN